MATVSSRCGCCVVRTSSPLTFPCRKPTAARLLPTLAGLKSGVERLHYSSELHRCGWELRICAEMSRPCSSRLQTCRSAPQRCGFRTATGQSGTGDVQSTTDVIQFDTATQLFGNTSRAVRDRSAALGDGCGPVRRREIAAESGKDAVGDCTNPASYRGRQRKRRIATLPNRRGQDDSRHQRPHRVTGLNRPLFYRPRRKRR